MTPRASSLASRAWTVPRATPSWRATSRRPTRGFARRVEIRRASSSSMVILHSLSCESAHIVAVLRSRDGHTCQPWARVLHCEPSDDDDGRAMFEEGQLYSPVSAGGDGEVTVHLADDHPGANDPAYRRRRNEIAATALAWEPGTPAPHIDYEDA